MEYVVVSAVAFVMSGVTLFSGFGLGTVLMPVFALFFPVPVAIAATAVVHLANNGFKLVLIGRQADWTVVRRFGVAAAAAALAGAGMLSLFASLPAVVAYRLGGREFQVTAVKAVIGALIVVFAWLEASRRFERLTFSPRHLVAGGVLSGFFGGAVRQPGRLPVGVPDPGRTRQAGLHRYERRLRRRRRRRPAGGLRPVVPGPAEARACGGPGGRGRGRDRLRVPGRVDRGARARAGDVAGRPRRRRDDADPRRRRPPDGGAVAAPGRGAAGRERAPG